MNTANGFFYTQLAIWAGFMLAYTNTNDNENYYKVRSYDAVNKLAPAILLIISIVLFRCKLKIKSSKKFFAIEKLMIVHMTLFISYVLVYTASLLIWHLWFNTDPASREYCRL